MTQTEIITMSSKTVNVIKDGNVDKKKILNEMDRGNLTMQSQQARIFIGTNANKLQPRHLEPLELTMTVTVTMITTMIMTMIMTMILTMILAMITTMAMTKEAAWVQPRHLEPLELALTVLLPRL